MLSPVFGTFGVVPGAVGGFAEGNETFDAVAVAGLGAGFEGVVQFAVVFGNDFLVLQQVGEGKTGGADAVAVGVGDFAALAFRGLFHFALAFLAAFLFCQPGDEQTGPVGRIGNAAFVSLAELLHGLLQVAFHAPAAFEADAKVEGGVGVALIGRETEMAVGSGFVRRAAVAVEYHVAEQVAIAGAGPVGGALQGRFEEFAGACLLCLIVRCCEYFGQFGLRGGQGLVAFCCTFQPRIGRPVSQRSARALRVSSISVFGAMP